MAALASIPAPWDHPIPEATVHNAIRIGKYLIPHAKAAFAEMGADEFVARAKAILRWIELNEIDWFSKRDLHQSLRGTFKRVEEVDRPLALLSSHDFIRQREPAAADGTGRKASPVFDVNPIWTAQLARQARSSAGEGDSEHCEDSEEASSYQAQSTGSRSVKRPQANETSELE